MHLKGLAVKGAPIYADSGIPPTRMPPRIARRRQKSKETVEAMTKRYLTRRFGYVFERRRFA